MPILRVAKVIGICASTGGPQALASILGALPASFPIPVLVVQHISAGFTEGLAHWLDGAVALPVQLAQSGVQADAGVWLAPDGAHLTMGPSGELLLDDTTNNGPHRPSGDVLLRSLAASAGKGTASVVLTGMGHDGAEGSRAVRQAGGLTIAQDEASSVIYGMPRAATAFGVDLVLPLAEIGPELAALSVLEVAR
jgi:two-component system chemotaxis response regulator CheB